MDGGLKSVRKGKEVGTEWLGYAGEYMIEHTGECVWSHPIVLWSTDLIIAQKPPSRGTS